MRKMFTTLKSVVAATVIAAMALAASCSYDDSAINERVDRVEKDLAALTERVAALEKKLGEEVDALKKLIEKQTVVTKVEKADDGSTKVTLSDGSSFTVYPKAEAGAEAVDTTIAPNKDTDGTYYWAVFDGGKFQKYLEVDGKKVPVFAAEAEEGESCVCELKFQVSEETGKLLVSIDGGKTWVDSGLAAQQVASTGVFSDVVVNDDNTVTFTLADGDKFSVALAELIECEATRSGVYVLPGEVKAVRFTVNDAVEDINIMNQPHGWAATVEVAPVEEENGDENVDGPVAEPQAVGGTEYVLNIAGPAVGDEYAAKEGVVSVHFNTANGACKVLSVNVNLAEITMSIDKDGNLTITNSVAMLQEGHQGSYVDFADFCFGFTTASDYQSYLDGDQPDLLYWQVTHRFFLGQILENGLKPYEENVYEKETITVSCDAIVKRLTSKDAEYGKEYVFFASLGETMVQGQTFPDLANAAVATYTKTLVDAEVVETAWNDATLKLSLLGYNSYIVGWVSTETVEQIMEENGYKTLDEFYNRYLRNQMSGSGFDMSIGAVMFPTMMGYTIKDTEIALSEMAEYSMTEWAPSVEPGTEYRLFVFPFNVDFNNLEMEPYTGVFDYSNVVDFGTFSTDALVEGEFDAAATFGEPYFEDNGVEVSVTIDGDDVVYVAYQFFNTPVAYTSDRVEDMFGEYFFYTELVELDDTKAFNASHYDVSNPCYLSMVLINADGEFVFVEKECVEYTEYEFTSCENTAGNTYVFKNDTYAWTLNLKDALASGTFTQSDTDNTYWDGNNTTLKAFTDANPSYIYSGTLTVVLGDNDALKVELLSTDTWIGGKKTPIKFVFDGTIGADQGGNAGGDIQVTSFEYLGRSGDIDDNPETSAGDYVYKLVGADGNEYKIGVYWGSCDADTNAIMRGVYGYCTNYFDAMYSSWNGFVIESATYYYDSTLLVEKGKLTLKLNGVGVYVYEDDSIGQVGIEIPDTSNMTLNLLKASPQSGYGSFWLGDSEGKNAMRIEVNDCPLVNCTYTFDPNNGSSSAPGTFYGNGCYVCYEGVEKDTSAYFQSGTVKVEVDGTYCRITVDVVLDNNAVYKGVYTGSVPF